MKRRARNPFANDDEALLEVALICNSFGLNPAEYIGLKDEVLKKDFVRAAHYRLRVHKNKEKLDFLKGVNLAVMTAMAGEQLKFDNEE